MPTQPTWPLLSRDEVVRNQLTILGREVFDLKRFAGRHRGGAAAVSALLGEDGTRRFLCAHAKNGLALRILERLKVGEVHDQALHPEDRHLAVLEQRFRRAGLFRYHFLWLAGDLLLLLSPFLLALLAAQRCAPLAFLLLCLATLHHTYFAHDARHDSIFAREQTGRAWVDVLGALVFGTTLNQQADEHRMHHAFTNTFDLDDALRIRPMVWHRRMLRRHGRRWLRCQPLLWFALLMPMAYPYMLFTGLRDLLRRRRYWFFAAILVRWLLLGLWLHSAALLLLPQVLVSCFQSFLSSLNHYHLKMAAGPAASHARTMIERTQNTDPGPVWTWLCGGLNYHVEHHLFPTMPRRHYPRIAPVIRDFCRTHGIPYHRCSKWAAMGQMMRKLRFPLRPTAG